MKPPRPAGAVHVETMPGLGGAVALVTIDYPPLNVGSQVQRADLLRTIQGLGRVEGLRGVVLRGANGNFVAGSDIREFDADPLPPHLPEVIAALEALPVPVVAAIEGAALGGGYELALGCDARVAAPDAVVGLPEVTLGLIPGAGGTQRVARLVGVAQAIGLITSGRRVKAAAVVEMGLVDALADGDLLAAAVAHLAGPAGRKRRLRDAAVPGDAPDDIAKAEAEALRKGKGADAVAAAIAAIKSSVTTNVAAALEAERANSLRLRRAPQSRALRHLFFAERAALKLPGRAAPQEVRRVGVVGAGRMGQGIALAFAAAGFSVRLAERDAAVLQAGLAALGDSAGQLAARRRAASAEALTARIAAGDLDAMADCDLVVEAITEDMAAKQAVFASLDGIVGKDAVLASNTSYLDIDAIAAATARPDRIGGLHFFNPAQVMRLVEVIRAARTSRITEATLLAVCRRLGKVPVVARVGEGFIGNRIFSAYRRQCEFLLEEGCLPQQVDRALRDFGMAMGPFAVFDLVGLDIAWATRKRLAPARDPRARYVGIADRLCEQGRFGCKTGKGWYDYAASPRGDADPAVTALIEESSTAKGMTRRRFSDDEIRARLLAAIVNEGAWVLHDGIAARPADIDLVMVHGYGFPALKGGPLHWAAEQPRAAFLDSVAAMAEASGFGIEVAPNLAGVLES